MLNKQIKEVSIFFTAVIILSYFIFWGPIALFKIPTANLVEGAVGPIWAIILVMIGGFVPSITGIALTAKYEGKKGVQQLLKKSFSFIGFKWSLIIILITFYYTFSLILIYTILGGEFDYSQFWVQLPSILPLILLGPLSEEYGWRGFALKRLLKFTNPNLASLIVGLIWSLWHLPLFFMLGTTQYEFNLSFFAYLLTVTSSSFIYTYIYIRTKQRLFSAIFFHWIYTYGIQVVYSSVVRTNLFNWLEIVPGVLIALVFIILLHKEKVRA